MSHRSRRQPAPGPPANGHGRDPIATLADQPAAGRPAAGPAPIEPLLLHPPQAAHYLGISDRKLWQLTKDGAVRSVRIGRSVRYDRRDLIAYVDTLRR